MQDKKRVMQEQMVDIYSMYQEDDGQNPVTSISYYNQIIIKAEQSLAMYGLEDVCVVKMGNTKDPQKYDFSIYQDGTQIGIIDENSNIVFSQGYLGKMKNASPQIYSILKTLDGTHFELPETNEKDEKLPEISEDQIEDFEMDKTALEEGRANLSEIRRRINAREAENGELKAGEIPAKDAQGENEVEDAMEAEEPESEEDNMKKIAQKNGITMDNIKSCATIKPSEKITDAQSFEDITNCKGKYEKIFVVASNSKTEGDSRFAFWGLTKDGQVEQIKGLEERQGVNTGKSIYTINRDGSEVKSEQTAAYFTMPNQRDGFSVIIGQYGIIETQYVRQSPSENKAIGSDINSSTQKPTTRQVKEFMNRGRTTDTELQDSINLAEEETGKDGKGTTVIENIDDNPYNDVPDEEIDDEHSNSDSSNGGRSRAEEALQNRYKYM